MDYQSEFLALSPPPLKQPRFNLFAAVLPDQETALFISEKIPSIREKHKLSGAALASNHLHMTLHPFGGFDEVPNQLVADLSRACSALALITSPFEVQLNRLAGFGEGSKDAVFLKGDECTEISFGKLHRMLLSELLNVQRLQKEDTKAKYKPKPHLTLLYDRQGVPEHDITPVCWTAREIGLVLSEVRAKTHHSLGRWQFGA